MSKTQREKSLSGCYKSTHYAGDLVNKFYDAAGNPKPLPFSQAVEPLDRLQRTLGEAYWAAKALHREARLRAKQKKA